jgi:limonene-1,2-epoxide hydrolase
MDWERFVATVEEPGGPDGFAALFADGGQFCDPVTPWTTDVRKVAEDTDRLFPDWRMRVDQVRAGDGWAVLEWTGTGTFGAAAPGPAAAAVGAGGTTVTVHGASVIEVDGDGKVTRWRDYLDTNEPIGQLRAATR